jgi:uroporphyrinogen III methyltransferase / synthase
MSGREARRTMPGEPAPRLDGQRVVVTRSAEDSDDWAERLAREGAEVVVVPCIASELIDAPELRTALAAAIGAANWLVFTSRRGVEAFATLHPRALPADLCIAAVGAATGAAARHALGRVDHVGEGTAAALADSLVADRAVAAGQRCVLALAANAGGTLERTLQAHGAECRRFDVYRTVPAAPREPKRPLSALRADKILFASPSAVEGFLNQVTIDTQARIFTIGPSTSAAARSRGLDVTGEARVASLDGLMEALHG